MVFIRDIAPLVTFGGLEKLTGTDEEIQQFGSGQRGSLA
jgi:hypothetical protein